MSGKHLKIIDGGGESGDSWVPLAIGLTIFGVIVYFTRKRKLENDTRRSNIRLAEPPGDGSGTTETTTTSGGGKNPLAAIDRILGDTR